MGIPSVPAPAGHSCGLGSSGGSSLDLISSVLDLCFIWHIPISLFCLLLCGGGGLWCLLFPVHTHTECFPENMLEIGLGFNSRWILGRSCPVAPSDYSQSPTWQVLNGINGGNNSVLCMNIFNSNSWSQICSPGASVWTHRFFCGNCRDSAALLHRGAGILDYILWYQLVSVVDWNPLP